MVTVGGCFLQLSNLFWHPVHTAQICTPRSILDTILVVEVAFAFSMDAFFF